ncbi:myelin-associated glycoprotein-like [Tachysurus vachellii]|uniref:myelin-associated glycoprotein-like n=1 Tax=Tachysurus vachellii TaxID=175792 RepID=UPI00296AB93A|nr:myelin-associated glycoprotein-like [Tachysurus vachellii]XP_060744623.1 myelin-associated glycoprotein-like [Tachysurus vachellii]
MDLQPKILFGWICLQVNFASVFSDVWKAQVVPEMNAVVSSCVVLPCTFNYPAAQFPASRIKAIWHKKGDRSYCIFDDNTHNINDNFKGRTKLVGNLGEKNCTLEIDKVKDTDNGPFCFRVEIKDLDKFSFEEACVHTIMKAKPEEISIDSEESVTEGSNAIFKCSMRHTCPTHPPEIKWSRSDRVKVRVSHKNNGHGVWEVESIMSFTATEADDHTDITCTVTSHGYIESKITRKMFIKREQSYLHIIIPVVAVFGTIILFGTACFFVTKRYRKQIQDLQSRNPNGVWSRLSRMSHRVRSVGRMRDRA